MESRGNESSRSIGRSSRDYTMFCSRASDKLSEVNANNP